jgi:hypothetical protein
MKDPCLTSALRHIGKNPAWTPAREYYGDRPCLPLAAYARISRWARWYHTGAGHWFILRPRIRRAN